MKLFQFALLLSIGTPAFAQAITCDSLKAEIEAKFKARGIESVSLVVLPVGDAASSPAIVGSCENGSRRIVRTGALVAARKPPASPTTPITTECKPGFTGPDCRERVPAPKP